MKGSSFILINDTAASIDQLSKFAHINFRLEADRHTPIMFEHGSLDHGRLRYHQVDRFVCAQFPFGCIRKLAKRRSGAIKHALPARFFAPLLDLGAFNASGF
jgi:hypothetical protein